MSKIKSYAKFIAASACLLPSSCVSSYFAGRRMGARTDGHIIFNEPVWIENCLWLLAIGLIIFWGWLGNRILENGKK